jgi:rSAM/selenodomain-associated transferase 1
VSGRGAIVVFAKAPRAGWVKTRLCPPLSPEQAAQLYAALLADVLRATAGFAKSLGLEALLAVHPAAACSELARSAPTPYRVVRQRGADLAARMGWAVREAAAAGCERVILRGSDSPALDGQAVAQANEALDRHDVVIVPDRDGGYGLVGLRRFAPAIFAHPMSTASVLDQTRALARSLGLRVRVQAPSFDIDTFEALRELARARTASALAALCPRTLALLDREDLWPGAGPERVGRSR